MLSLFKPCQLFPAFLISLLPRVPCFSVPLYKVTVGGVTLKIPPSAFQLNLTDTYDFTGTIFDTGTTLAGFASPIYAALLPALQGGSTAPRVEMPESGSDLCFRANETSKFATVQLYFRGGVVVTVPPLGGVSLVRRT